MARFGVSQQVGAVAQWGVMKETKVIPVGATSCFLRLMTRDTGTDIHFMRNMTDCPVDTTRRPDRTVVLNF